MVFVTALIGAAVVGALWWRSHRQTVEVWDRLEEVLRDLAEDRQPKRLIFHSHNGGAITALMDKFAIKVGGLRQQIEREGFNLQTILATMEDGVMIVDAQHVLRVANPAFLRIFDLKQSPIGQSVLQVLRDAQFEQAITAAFSAGAPHTTEVAMSRTRPARHFAVHAAAIQDERQQPAVVAILRETTRLKQLEEVRREFVANVSHELRTPLSIFHGYVENLSDNPEMERADQAEIFKILHKHSERLNALLEDLLTLARLESRPDKLDLRPLDLATLIRGVSAEWLKRAESKGIAVDHDLPELPAIEGDASKLEQVFNNLLENAVKYTEHGGRVRVTAALTGREVEVAFADTGIGILPADLPHVFERFYRADKARTRGGTGLGLSIVKHIVQLHGGTVSAQSTYGEGTTVTLRMPLVGQRVVSQAAPRSST